MLLKEVLEQADALAPNSIKLRIKIGWINNIMREHYRDYPTQESIMKFQTTVGEPAYELPGYCPVDRITALMVGKQEYPYIPLVSEDIQPDYFFTSFVTGQIFFYPTPKKREEAVLYYRPRPYEMTEADMEKEPPFPPDFHEMLVLGVASRSAKASKDKDMRALIPVYEADFQRLAEKADLVLVKPRQKTVMNVRPYR